MKRISIFSVFFLTSILVRAPIHAQESIEVLESLRNIDVKNGKVLFFSDAPRLQEEYFSVTIDSPYVGSVNGWEFFDNSFFSKGVFTEVGSYFSEKYGQNGQTFYHKGESVPGRNTDSLFWMNTYFDKKVEEFTLPREFWISANLDFYEGEAFPPWFDVNIWYRDDPVFFHGIFLLGIGYSTPWDSVHIPVTFVVKMPEEYYRESVDSGWVFHGLSINIMSSLETTEPYTQELGYWFSGIRAVYYDDNQCDTSIVVLDDFLVTSYNDDEEIIPLELALSQNYPNPFNPATTITFSLPKSDNVRLEVYSILGERVMTVVDRYYMSGDHRVSIDFSGANLPSGVYIYTLTSSTKILSKKMLFLK